MTMPFCYSTTYKLDKSHFSETFDQSYTVKSSKSPYLKSLILALSGAAILLFSNVTAYLAWFILVLGVVEALNVRFKKPWWLARQMLSRAANSELTLTIDENGITSKSFYVDSSILWSDITKIEQTSKGWLFYLTNGKSYLSNRCLSPQAGQFISEKAKQKAQ
jgi:hypothetical protein